QGTGDHYWRNDPEIIRQQKVHYQSLFNHLTVGVYAPGTPPSVFVDLFPENFHLLENPDDLGAFITFNNLHHILVLPYAPVTLVK
ncbi:MAG TPA: hypothetical protein VEC37_04930, partial [Bacillota bacterium]|nr:hypothetical protein [Bacillota bacterium]